ncbi:uncharacterized protein SPPG_02567 [Spizellomyces punctatus DAOM BR117]|uniref:Centrosomal protein of 70 kDa n=1 Tax=Spizellomyces punctatus (strain DAOM BR117) TaxID=645134 RepID=A0A0L0HMQ3_SPIPD|nr:uncharacterized protein SPPG_02567 [Spizellomyces punctatus DAOM BR117]KND02064.1 hypothetical protein SPPG_02567 [Spizellomyces punctatus DAOM BR117]|eukprot:XP_016610103.1 hypothetical protein SPPG_02567 [Spizellomyces punctatus DAOM BR117]
MSLRRPSSNFQESVLTASVTSRVTSPGHSRAATSAIDHTDTEDFVRYLLEGSGAEKNVDFAALRRDLEISTPSISKVLDLQSYNTTDSSPSSNTSRIPHVGSREQADGRFELGASEEELPRTFPSDTEFRKTAREHERIPSSYEQRRPADVAPSYLGTSGRRSPPTAALNPPFRNDPAPHAVENEPDITGTRSAPLHTNSLRSATLTADLNTNSRAFSNVLTDSTVKPIRGLERQSSHDIQDSRGGPVSDGPSNRFTSASGDVFRSRLPSVTEELGTFRPTDPLISTRSRSMHGLAEYQSAALQDLSAQLTSAGFPPLHPALLYSNVGDPGTPGVLSERQVEALKSTFSSLITEYVRRGEMVQNLVNKVAQVEKQGEIWHEKAKEAEAQRQRAGGNDMRTIDELQKTIKASVTQNATLTAELATARAECADLRKRYESLKKHMKEEEDRVERIKMEMAHMVEKAEKTRQRNERTFMTITGQYHRNPNKSGLDRLTLEVIEVYEDKLSKARQEVETLRVKLVEMSQQTRSRSSPQEEANGKFEPMSSFRASKNGHSSRAVSARDGIDLEAELAARGKGALELTLEEERAEQLQRAMGQQINGLQARLEAMTQALRESQKEADLLKLQLLASKKADWMEQTKRERANGLKTRDLIRMDKKAYKLRLFKIDNLSLEECQELLKDVCVKFDINDIDRLSTALETVETVIRLVPQMEKFIQGVDGAVWAHKSRFLGDNENEGDVQLGPRLYHRLPETLEVVESWAKSIGDIEVLRDFRRRVHDIMRTRQTASSDENCLEAIRRMQSGQQQRQRVPSAGAPVNDAAYLAVNHFRDLFELRPTEDVQAKMNDLYVFYAEVQAGLGRLRDTLGLDHSIQPGRVLVHAADAVHSLAELSEAMRKSIRRTSLEKLRRPLTPPAQNVRERRDDNGQVTHFRERSTSPVDRRGGGGSGDFVPIHGVDDVGADAHRVERERNGHFGASNSRFLSRRGDESGPRNPSVHSQSETGPSARFQDHGGHTVSSRPEPSGSPRFPRADMGGAGRDRIPSPQSGSYRVERLGSHTGTADRGRSAPLDAEAQLSSLLARPDMQPSSRTQREPPFSGKSSLSRDRNRLDEILRFGEELARSPKSGRAYRDNGQRSNSPDRLGGRSSPISLTVQRPVSTDRFRTPRTSTPEYGHFDEKEGMYGQGAGWAGDEGFDGRPSEHDEQDDFEKVLEEEGRNIRLSMDDDIPTHIGRAESREETLSRRSKHSPGLSGVQMLTGVMNYGDEDNEASQSMLDVPSQAVGIDPDVLFGRRGSETVLMEGTVEGVNLSFGEMNVAPEGNDEFSFAVGT